MKRFFGLVFLATATAAVALLPTAAVGQNVSPLAGVWTFNPTLSELPREIGFNLAWLPSQGGTGQNGGSSGGSSGGGSSSGGRGRRGSGGGGGGGRAGSGNFSIPRESYDDARRVQLLTAEARHPPQRLIVVDTAAAVTITNELGQSRTLHPTGKEEAIELQGVPFMATAKREGDRLVVDYRVEQDREVRYTYSHAESPSQLVVEVQFLERGAGDKSRCVYEPGGTETAAGSPGPSPGAPATGAAKPPTPEAFDARPGAELRGLKSLGILVEDLSAQAVSCGLNHDTLEASLSKRLTDGGFTVRKNSDDDTYVYVNIMTTTLPSGTCVSRYDAFLYTHATANLSYHDKPVLVQVSLIHRGGIGSSAPVAHAAAVARGLESYVDLLITQIRDANK